ncbi:MULTISPECIES: family 2A encapsulin nanocompartment cargo protein cysteine desulfurase [unclassified Arcicella]|uniref:family 2A encapsulin nanocompartment cargo protein cysteine desulfurase n=1 Tax=unclassified Arcicella TaxID=2644986 RepID=UPI002865362E|nr:MULTISPECIES: family 2A encapsulin nanocompartment cargo protein cysteine desulfurase [unclassified Arcicella]MDR6562036.1 cysteine desulfurase/selenocysteine lyase [Arcicella sp. BE51]MDR6811908.1 cysteine desulfurase/selenocysteine lyase [Arcicella sp. BE140]MDR6822938.1 cysteine desulfurase/selenocysteine lyase [Arcicella sp. BE139]
MNINTNQQGNILHGIPSVEDLQQLANDIFKALPNEVPKEISLNPQEHPKANHFAERLYETLQGVPTSSTRVGVSPSAFQHGSVFQPIGNAGVQPQTSLPDPHFANPASQPSFSGFGASASALPNIGTVDSKSPLAATSLFELDTNNILPSLSTFGYIPSVQTPAPIGINDASYYFLSGQNQNPYRTYDKVPQFQEKTSSYESFGATSPAFDANLIKKDFPILQERVNGRPLVWLDNAATTQKPKQVIDRITYFYEHENSNIHRAAHELAARATDAYEGAREKVRAFLNARSTNEIVFVRGATEAINLVAKSWGEQNLKVGDEIIVSNLEHHANIVPWKQLADKKGLKIRVIPVDDDGQILLDEYAKLLNAKTRLVSFTQVSNALGTVTPAKQIIDLAHAAGAKVLVDGAQSVSHLRSDVIGLDCDWFVFSGHKVFGPTGIGVLYGKEELLNETQPWQGGGNMIVDVTFEQIQYHDAPSRFEAGTGNIADAVGLGAAIDYVNKIGIDVIHQYEHYLLVYATKLLKEIPGLRLIGTAKEKASVLSFIFDGYSNNEVGQALNKEGIAVRTGHHCAQPILRRFGLESTVRPSLAFYNTQSDVDLLVETLYKLRAGHKQAVR